jgi:hypothetical protein
MDRKKIEERIADLKGGILRMESSIHANNGAIQDCEYWLSELEKEENLGDEKQ